MCKQQKDHAENPDGVVAGNVAQTSLKLNVPATGWAWEIREGFLEGEEEEDK